MSDEGSSETTADGGWRRGFIGEDESGAPGGINEKRCDIDVRVHRGKRILRCVFDRDCSCFKGIMSRSSSSNQHLETRGCLRGVVFKPFVYSQTSDFEVVLRMKGN
ncbi:hypothetical protein Rs2_03081 [Raphanus sativus]|nr:hypothetical protein Rs2_52596 [Raphanus sativus]KAJ4917531.1 hypothetical protein Rs2_03081 [Raphanus sativus]